MKNEECVLVEELLPLYIEDITSSQTNALIEEHLKNCIKCNETFEKMKVNVHITTEPSKPSKKTLRYINSIKVWYLLCPLIAFVFLRFDLYVMLHLYEGILVLFSLSCIVSEIYHRSTWWDAECVELQRETREDVKRKRGRFYARPILLAIPSLLVIVIMELSRIINYISDYIV